MIKTGIIYETLGSVSNMQVVESKNPNEVRLSGVFGVCGVRNDNHRVYEKANYAKCLEALQTKIANNNCLGELEHPNSFNINLDNVSHIIEAIQMNEDGTVTGTVKLLNTPKGQIAKAIVEATANYDKPEVLAEVSKGLGQAMKGIEMSTLTAADKMQDRGI